MKFTSDVDIDFADRSEILKIINHIPASIRNSDKNSSHNTGIYPHQIPIDPFSQRSSLDYQEAESRGYIKLDFLNVHIYSQVRSPDHLTELLNMEPPWARLQEKQFCEQLIHIGNHYDTLMRMPEPVDSIPRLAMFLAVIRPGKRDLIGQSWAQVGKTVWKSSQDGYTFKKSHSIAYAHLVVVHMNLLARPVF